MPRGEHLLEPNHGVKLVRDVRIPMKDGTRLAADLYMPDGEGRFPAILEYLPYRKDDNTMPGLVGHLYFAERGFVGVRCDIRGTGNSEGLAVDEYPLQEQLDGAEVIAWLASQPWCNGSVGLYGYSWGGFNSIQIAMHRPRGLKAIVPIYATDDRYNDDVHYTHGAVHADDQAGYIFSMLAMNALPPYPEIGESWAEMWRLRLEKGEPWMLKWLEEQADGPYWRHASLKTDYEAIQCPTFIIGGWWDGYTNMCLRTFERLSVPKKLLVGPWTHARPHVCMPGPRINHFHEVLRWFGHWLRGDDTGIMEEPPITIFVREYTEPGCNRHEIKGYWRHEAGWPLDRARPETRYLRGDGALAREPGAPATLAFRYRPTVGTSDQVWCAGGQSARASAAGLAQFRTGELAGTNSGLPLDQRVDEPFGVCFTSEPLASDLELLGYPEVTLGFSSTATIANLCVRLTDVAPSGPSALVSRGFLNLTHRASDEEPELLEPGRPYQVKVAMDCTSWVFPAGHRLRVAVYGNSWPITWPSPFPATHTLHLGAEFRAAIDLPIVDEQHPALPQPTFEPWRGRTGMGTSAEGPATTEFAYDAMNHRSIIRRWTEETYHIHEGRTRFVTGRRSESAASDLDPADVSIRCNKWFEIERKGWEVRVESSLLLQSTAAHIQAAINLEVTLSGALHFHRQWLRTIPRRMF